MLSSELNQKIRDKVRGLIYQASDNAPDTFEKLKKYCSTGNLTVWSGGSDNTIYGDVVINHAFRAWHDLGHMILNAPFTLEGEIYVAKWQASQLGDNLGAIIMAEVKGQAEYFAKHGMFPNDQVSFIKQYLKTGKV